MTAPAKILVVDDLPQNVKLLADLLAVKGYAVATAASGAEALEKVETERPDLVLLDVMMPEMSGYEVCRAIRDNPATGILPVVMVTSLDPAAGAHQGAGGGCRRLPVQAREPGGAPGPRPLPGAREAALRHRRAPGRPARGVESNARGARGRASGPARAAGAAQALLLSAARRADRGRRRGRSPQEPPPRGDGGLPRPPRLHRVRRDGRARGGDERPARVSRRDGTPRRRPRGHARALHGRRDDGLLQRPRAGAEPRGAGRADGLGHAGAPRRAAAPLAQARRGSGPRHGHRPGYATIGAIGFEGGSTTARSGRSRTWPRGSAEKPDPARSWSLSACWPPSRTW